MNHIKNIEKKAGGVLLYIGDSIQYQNRPDLLMAQNFIENIFIEIEIQCLNTTKDIIIGFIYRVPDYNTIFFNQEQSRHFTNKYTKENKFIYLMDDYHNINILNVPKWVYPRVLWYCYANNSIPALTKQIRNKTRTLIDNIFSNNYQDNQNQEVQYMLIYQITPQFTI